MGARTMETTMLLDFCRDHGTPELTLKAREYLRARNLGPYVEKYDRMHSAQSTPTEKS